MSYVFMFPGQSSRYPEMIAKLLPHPAARALLSRASAALGRDLERTYALENPRLLASNRDVQVGVFLATAIHRALLEARGVTASWSFGHSLGEYSHLVHIGVLSFEEALRVVDARGALYDAGPRGAMLSIFPIELEELHPLIRAARRRRVLEIAAYNSPRQTVVAGDRAAVLELAELVARETFAQCSMIEDQLPMHCARFVPVAVELREVLESARWSAPTLPYVSNVLGRIVSDPEPKTFVGLLVRHVYRAVRFSDCVRSVAAARPSPIFVEVGPRAVLTNLLDRRWCPYERKKTDALGPTLDTSCAEASLGAV